MVDICRDWSETNELEKKNMSSNAHGDAVFMKKLYAMISPRKIESLIVETCTSHENNVKQQWFSVNVLPATFS